MLKNITYLVYSTKMYLGFVTSLNLGACIGDGLRKPKVKCGYSNQQVSSQTREVTKVADSRDKKEVMKPES